MHTWVLTTRHGKVLLEDKEILTSKKWKVFATVLCHQWLCIINTFFWHKRIHKYTWCRNSVEQRSIIDFCIDSADLFSSVVNVRVKTGAERSTDHLLVICILSGLNHSRTRKRFRAYRIKWKLLADKKVRHTFASIVASLFRELTDFAEDVETEWDLFKSAAFISAFASCG